MASALRHWPRILMRGFRIFGWTLCGLLGIVLLVLGFILSPAGTSWTLDKARTHGYLTYDHVEGAPFDDLVLEGLRVPFGTSELQAGRLEIRWATDCLLRGRLCIDSLKGQGVHLALGATNTSSQPTKSSSSMARVATPIPVELRELVLNDVSMSMATGLTLSWRHFASGATLESSQLTLANTVLSGTRVSPAPAPETVPAPVKTPVESRPALVNPLTAFSIHPLDLPASRIQLPEVILPLDVFVPSVKVHSVDIDGLATPLHIDAIDLALQTQGDRITVDTLHYAGPDGELDVKADLHLAGEYPLLLDMSGVVRHPPLKDERISLNASGSMAALRLQFQGGEQLPLKADLKADLLSQALPFSLSLNAPRLHWPIDELERRAAASFYRVDALDVYAEGDLNGYRLGADGTARINALKPMPIHLAGEGNDRQLTWSSLKVGVGSTGGLNSQGLVRWSPLLMATADVSLDRLQVDALAPQMPGLLSGRTQVVFQQREDASWTLQVPQLALDGMLMKQPLSLVGQFDGDSGFHWNIRHFDLRQGRNHLQAQGLIADQSNLKATIDAPALASLWPGLGGRFKGLVDVKGPLSAPRGHVELQGDQLRYGTHQLQHLMLKGAGDGGEDPSMALTLDASGVRSGTLALRSAGLTLKGHLSQHHLAFTVDGQKGSSVTNAKLVMDGGLDVQRHRYRARVMPLLVDTAQVGRLALEKPLMAEIDTQRSSAIIQPFCLVRAQGGRLCAEKMVTASADAGQAQIALMGLPMSLVDPFMPAPWHVAGSTQGRFDIRWSAGATRWSVNGDVANGVTVSGKDAAGNIYALPALNTHLQLNATPEKARLQTQMMLSNAGRVMADISVSDPLAKQQLSGQLKVDRVTLSPYRPLVAGIDMLEGALNGQIRLGGSLQHPRLDGQLVLNGVRAKGQIIPIGLDDARLAFNFHGEEGEIEGYLASGDARLLLNGKANWPLDAPWQVALSLRDNGTPLEVMALEYGRVKVSPHIDLKATPTLLSLQGSIDVPWARIEVAQLPPTVQTPSTDEVVLTHDEAAQLDRERAGLVNKHLSRERQWADASALQKAGMAIDLNVRVTFGKNVHLSAYGLNSNVGGGFDVRQRQNAIQLFGTVALNEGRYKAFGQDLLIQKGEVTFTGPATQPRLDIVAVRNPESIEDNVTAGVKVTGTALSPNIQVFSNPAMNETSALSYLLQGHGSDSGSNDNALTSALIGLSIAQSGSAVGAIGETFGIQDLTLDTAGSGDNSKVVVSGYVMPRLKVSYGVGVFSPIAELTLRYRLLQSLYLQGVSGASQALDLIYTFSLGRTPDTLPSDAVGQDVHSTQ